MNRPTPPATERPHHRTDPDPDPGTDGAAGGEPWVVCDAVSRHYGAGPGSVVAVDEVTATVSAGMRVALTGPSGSGKSTLLHLMAGLETSTEGRVRWPGFTVAPSGRPDLVGVVFQGPSLLPDLDVAENVGLPLLFGDRAPTSTGDPSAHPEDPVGEALGRVGIADLRDKLPEELSGGQAQRVAVARVLVSRPRLILADEPTGQLDHDTGRLVVSALLDAATELGAALVVATHDPRVAERLSEAWQMHDGRLVADPPAPHPVQELPR